MSEEIRLSRGFTTTVYDQEMPALELYVKSPIALILGILPFTISSVAMMTFRFMASSADAFAHKRDATDGFEQFVMRTLHILTASVGTATSAIMMLSIKLFSLSQTIVWGHYVEKPSGDGPNTRLAQYGAGSRPWEDLQRITTAFFCPFSLLDDAWKLRDWAHLEI